MQKKLILILIVYLTIACVGCGKEAEEDYIRKIKLPELPDSITVSLKDNVETDEVSAKEQEDFNSAYELLGYSENKESIAEFLMFIDNYPDSDLCDDAQFYIGMNYNELGKHRKAANAYAKVIVNYPNSSLISAAYEKIAFLYRYEFGKNDEALAYYVACLENLKMDDWYLLNTAVRAVKELSDIEFRLSYDYEVIDSFELANGGTYGDVLILDITPTTDKSIINKVMQEITAVEDFTEMALYCTMEAYKANWDSDYSSEENQNALEEGYIASSREGIIDYGDYCSKS